MGGFLNMGVLSQAILAGKRHSCSLRKVPSQASVSGNWIDLSMAAGNPKPNYYASSPLEAAVLDGFDGLFHGDDKSPSDMFLTGLSLCTPTAGLVGEYRLLDYLLYYPFIDLGDGDTQVMTNDITLPRYTDGAGVIAMLVVVAPTAGSEQFTFDYINQDGVQKTAPTQVCSTVAANIGTLATSQQGTVCSGGIFLRLASGDSGIRSIVSFTTLVPNGGLASLVLVKPLASHLVPEINMEAEKTFVNMQMALPRIYDGAYLNFIQNCSGSVAAGTLAGRLDFAWN
jgi:hypothetical protein